MTSEATTEMPEWADVPAMQQPTWPDPQAVTAVRDELRDHGTAEVLVDDGHRARKAYEQLHSGAAEVISGVTVGDDGWQQELRRQAHQGRVWVG